MTTNYYQTFIEVAEDCPITVAEIPPQKGTEKTIAVMQFEIIKNHPYQYTSDEVLFRVYALKNNITEEKWESEKAKFFAKGQPCFRSSPLTKRYGWGVHFNIEGKIAIYVMESDDYKKFSTDKNLKILRALRSKRI